jgi:hypothetical protein
MRIVELIIGIGLALGIVLVLVAHLGYGIVRDAEHRRRLGRRDRARGRGGRAGQSGSA